HQLEDCGLDVLEFTRLDDLLQSVANAPEGQPIALAVFGVNLKQLPPERLRQHVRELEAHGCKTLALCPTIEQAQYHESLPDVLGQLHAKPVCTRQLQQLLCQLLGSHPKRYSEPSPPVANGRAVRLLCVDDNPANLLLVQTLLNDMGADVVAVESGYAALERVKSEHFDLVFMDVQMPGMNGLQTTEAIRAWEAEQQSSQLPIIALTAHALANEKRGLLQGGMDDYLTKPISEHQLAQVVLKWTGFSLQNQQNLRPSATPLPSSTLPILDPEEGLRLAAGKADLAADMLAMLLASLQADRQTIRQAQENWDRRALIERVHRLHGATRYCGVPQLRAACQRAETLLKQDDPEARNALAQLDQAIERLAQETRIGV